MAFELPASDHRVPLGKAAVQREGSDVTVVSYARMAVQARAAAEQATAEGIFGRGGRPAHHRAVGPRDGARLGAQEIGRASCRERVCQDVSISVVAVSLTKNK